MLTVFLSFLIQILKNLDINTSVIKNVKYKKRFHKRYYDLISLKPETLNAYIKNQQKPGLSNFFYFLYEFYCFA